MTMMEEGSAGAAGEAGERGAGREAGFVTPPPFRPSQECPGAPGRPDKRARSRLLNFRMRPRKLFALGAVVPEGL